MEYHEHYYSKTFPLEDPYFSGGMISIDAKFLGGTINTRGNQGSLKLMAKDYGIILKGDENTQSFFYRGKTFALKLKSDKTFILFKNIDDNTLIVSNSSVSFTKQLSFSQDNKDWLESISIGLYDRKPSVNWSINTNFGLISFGYHNGEGKMLAAYLNPRYKVYSGITFNKGPSFPSFTGFKYKIFPRPVKSTVLQLNLCLHNDVSESISMGIKNLYSKHLNSYFSLYYDIVSNSRTIIADFIPDKPVSGRLFITNDTTTCTVSAQVTPKFEFSMSQNLTYIGKPNLSFKFGLGTFPVRKSLDELFSSKFSNFC